MILFVDENKGFLFIREWPPIVNRILGEIVTFTSKINKTILVTSRINLIRLISTITSSINSKSSILLQRTYNSIIMEVKNFNSKITKTILINSRITVIKIYTGTILTISSIFSNITSIFSRNSKLKD